MMTRRVFDISLRISITIAELLLSNAPVDSSAKMILGSVAKARAIATLCCWPPDNWDGFLSFKSKIPIFSNANKDLLSTSLVL